MAQYTNLKQASLARDFLHTNSTSHDFLFGAMAELVDNSRDAGAKNLYIYTEPHDNVRGNYSLNFLDDGKGMDAIDAHNVVLFGYSSKKDQSLDLIGQYGNGLKSASMRIGKDLIFFTKKDGIKTIVLLSRSFLEGELCENDGIRVPMPSFYQNDQPFYVDGETSMNKEIHELEMKALVKYSPFRSKTDILRQFSKIDGMSGTLVICYNLQLLDNGETEFDCESDPTDIKIAYSRVDHSGRKSQFENNSFRAYVSILYTNPKMKIYIQNKKVHTKILERTLYSPMRYKYQSTKFKARDAANKKLAEENLKKAEHNLRDKSSVFNDFKIKYDKKLASDVTVLNVKRRAKEDAESDVSACKLNLAHINKNFNEPKTLDFIFGVNVHNRAADGLFIYNCHRLILMHEHTKQQTKSLEFRGIVGVVDVPRMVLQPMHNKQRFIDTREEQMLITQMATYMEYYVQELHSSKGLKLDLVFWKRFGYFDMHFNYLPDEEDGPKRIRIMETKTLVQCNKCLQWRVLPWNRRQLKSGYPSDEWECNDNTVVDNNSCKFPEHLFEIELRNIPAPPPAASSTNENPRGFSITLKSNNQIVNRTYLAPKKTNEFLKRNRTDASLTLTHSDNDSDVSTMDDRRRDPDFGLDTNRKKKNKTISSTNNSNLNSNNFVAEQQRLAPEHTQSIFERNIIREDADTSLQAIKPEPSVAMETTCAPKQNGRAADSGIDMDSLTSGTDNVSMVSDYTKAFRNTLRNLLSMMCHSIDDRQQMASLRTANDEALVNFDYSPFLMRYDAAVTEAAVASKNKETKRKVKKRLEEVLRRKLGKEVAAEVIDEVFQRSAEKQ